MWGSIAGLRNCLKTIMTCETTLKEISVQNYVHYSTVRYWATVVKPFGVPFPKPIGKRPAKTKWVLVFDKDEVDKWLELWGRYRQ